MQRIEFPVWNPYQFPTAAVRNTTNWQLMQRALIVTQFWKLAARDRGIGRAGSFQGPGGKDPLPASLLGW